MKRGQIRWYKFSKPDKKRPVLLLTRDSIIPYLGEITIAPITTTIRNIPSEVYLSRQDGMPRACVINCDHIQTISKGKIGTLVTTISADKMNMVSKSIGFALNL